MSSCARVIYHSDGAITAAVPGLRHLAMGIHVLQALQFDAAWHDRLLKTHFGDRLFAGGEPEYTLPFGTPEDWCATKSAASAPSWAGKADTCSVPFHAIHSDTCPEKITALFDTAMEPIHL